MSCVRYVSSIAQAAVQSSYNTLIILTQKLITSPAQIGPLVSRVLCNSALKVTGIDSTSPGGSERSRNIPPCSPVYHYPSSCVGVLLASYMLRHFLGKADWSDPQSPHLQDSSALLVGINNLLSKCKNATVAYALDILSNVATNIHRV